MISSLLCDAVRDNHILNTPNWSILNMNFLAISFLFINVTAEPIWRWFKSKSLPATKHLYECLLGLQSIQTLLFTRGGFGYRLLLLCSLHCWKILPLQSSHLMLCNSMLNKFWCRKQLMCFAELNTILLWLNTWAMIIPCPLNKRENLIWLDFLLSVWSVSPQF